MSLWNHLVTHFPRQVDICLEHDINPCTSDVYNILLNGEGGAYQIMDYHRFYQQVYMSEVIPDAEQWQHIQHDPEYIEIYEALCYIDSHSQLPSLHSIVIHHDSGVMLEIYYHRIVTSPYLAEILTLISELVALAIGPNCLDWLTHRGLLNRSVFEQTALDTFNYENLIYLRSNLLDQDQNLQSGLFDRV